MKRLVVAAATAGALSLPSIAFAFVQTMTCNPNGGPFVCDAGETPRPVHWSGRCIVYYVNETGALDVSADPTTIHDSVLEATRLSFNAWNDVPQSDLLLQLGGLTNEDRAEHDAGRGAEGNANIVVWRDADWPYASKTAFAITSVTFDPSTGVIVDADIELNGENHRFTVGNTGSVVDIQNTLTHEVGHFFGLDHTAIPDATMFGSAPEGEVQKRSLHADDIQGIVSIYPSQGDNVDCGSFPEYFQKPDGEELDKGCCFGASSVPQSTPAPLLALLLGAVFALRRRRR